MTGSRHVSDLKLNDRFILNALVAFTWDEAALRTDSSIQIEASCDWRVLCPQPRSIPRGIAQEGGVVDWAGRGCARDREAGRSSFADPRPSLPSSPLWVQVDVPAPFSFMPKSALEAVVDTALGTVLFVMRDAFIRHLVTDCGKWCAANPAQAAMAAGTAAEQAVMATDGSASEADG